MVKHEEYFYEVSLLEEITSAMQRDFGVAYITVQIETKTYSATCSSMHCTNN
ncbi:MAG: hypothetical protein ACI97K_001755 [Glaciecola sp.]|jgi:hypothetical protein